MLFYHGGIDGCYKSFDAEKSWGHFLCSQMLAGTNIYEKWYLPRYGNCPCLCSHMGTKSWSASIHMYLHVYIHTDVHPNDGFSGMISKSFSSIYCKPSICVYWVTVQDFFLFLAPWSNIWRSGGLKIGQIWGFRTITKKVFIQCQTLLVCLLGEHSETFFIFGPLAKLPRWCL